MVKQNDGNESTDESLSEIMQSNAIYTNKLEADQYLAEDLDGVTEGVFGSGNVG